MANTRRKLAAGAAAALFTFGGAMPAAADEHTIVLRVLGKQTRIAQRNFEAGQRDAAAIYERVGVSFVWADDPTANVPQPHLTFHVVVVSEVDSQFVKAGLPNTALGIAPTGTDRAYIFCDRIAALAQQSHQRVDVILGRVLAHELGHLMLGEGHSTAGIMKAKLDYGSWETPEFSSEQGQDIRERIATFFLMPVFAGGSRLQR